MLFPQIVTEKVAKFAEPPTARRTCHAAVPVAALPTTMVTFERGSAVLSEGVRDFLDRMAVALKKRSQDVGRILVEGHTDATGSLPINRLLSKKRADSVKSYFAQKHGIRNVSTVGGASDELADPKDPGSHLNRRTEVMVFPRNSGG